ncbi:MAG: hypothetical protein HY721_11660 [Planctomycetes bacterium]|nr:hypothetical protein [Planctomycetota bacterium]
MSARKRAAVVAAVAGTLAATVLVAAGLLWLSRKSEAVQLLEIIRRGPEPDAAWAFETLKELEAEGVEADLRGRMEDERRTALRLVSHASESGSGAHWDPDGHKVGDVVRIVLGVRKEMPRERPPARRTSSLLPPRVVPPSEVPALARLAATGDAAGLLRLVGGGSLAEASWALECLRALPDQDLEELAPFAGSYERARVTTLACEQATISSLSITVGQVVRFLLCARMVHSKTRLWTEADADAEDIERLLAAWKAYRARKAGS